MISYNHMFLLVECLFDQLIFNPCSQVPGFDWLDFCRFSHLTKKTCRDGFFAGKVLEKTLRNMSHFYRDLCVLAIFQEENDSWWQRNKNVTDKFRTEQQTFFKQCKINRTLEKRTALLLSCCYKIMRFLGGWWNVRFLEFGVDFVSVA